MTGAPARRLPPPGSWQGDALPDAGRQLLAAGRAGLLLDNRDPAPGLGGRGAAVARVLGSRTILALQADRLRRLGAELRTTVPWTVLCSESTLGPTRAHLDELGLPDRTAPLDVEYLLAAPAHDPAAALDPRLLGAFAAWGLDALVERTDRGESGAVWWRGSPGALPPDAARVVVPSSRSLPLLDRGAVSRAQPQLRSMFGVGLVVLSSPGVPR